MDPAFPAVEGRVSAASTSSCRAEPAARLERRSGSGRAGGSADRCQLTTSSENRLGAGMAGDVKLSVMSVIWLLLASGHSPCCSIWSCHVCSRKTRARIHPPAFIGMTAAQRYRIALPMIYLARCEGCGGCSFARRCPACGADCDPQPAVRRLASMTAMAFNRGHPAHLAVHRHQRFCELIADR